jgi:hypothetical protein
MLIRMREHSTVFWIALIVCAHVASCTPEGKRELSPSAAAQAKSKTAKAPISLTAVDLSDAVHPIPKAGPVELATAKNEWTSFVLQVGPRMPGVAYSLRLTQLHRAPETNATGTIATEVYQVLSMPVDVNRAGYVRYTGQDASRGELPRAMLPMQLNNRIVDLAKLRDASRPTDPTAIAPLPEPALLWIDLRVPADAPAGEYAARCEVLANGQVAATLPVQLKVHDFVLPAERHLQMVGRLDWDDLERLYPDRFEAVPARLVNRNEKKYAGTVQALDSLLALAHRHRTSVIVPRLQPTVKWPPNAPPQIDWREFDSLVAPWLTGDAFEDKMPLDFWPLPAPDMIDHLIRKSQLDYWGLAATHFDQNDWLHRAPLWIEKVTPGRATDSEAAALSKLAAETLAMDPRVRAALPLELDQLRVAENAQPGNVGQIPAESTGRLWVAAPPLVSAPPMGLWLDAVERPRHYLRTDMPALLPYVGAGGDERDVRLWAWLAYLREASLINFSDALPSLSNPTDAADPNELIWFYPGEWFGQDEPVATIQLKWLRRAQQDYEYLWLARERGQRADPKDLTHVNTKLMARLITKPVEIQPGQDPDPSYALMSGTTNQEVWNDAQQLLTEMILLNKPGQAADPRDADTVGFQMLRWAVPQERPLLMGRTAEWSMEADGGDVWLRLRCGIDVYNASDTMPKENLLGWTSVPRASGWQIDTRPVGVPVLSTYNVRRAAIDARFDLSKLTPSARQPMELTFTNGFNHNTTSLKFVVPIASSELRKNAIRVDGKLAADWDQADLIQSGPLVKMLSRPSLQEQKLEFAATPSKIYTSWSDKDFYIAFDLAGVNPAAAARARNFADYQFRRAWSEDLCEILIQPVLADGRPQPVVHVVCKPNGSCWVERKNASPDAPGKSWYATSLEGEQWRGELRIPWKAILAAAAAGEKAGENAEAPTLLRFNFAQHRTATGESASWAGPVDFGRDDSFMGVLYLRDPEEVDNLAEGIRSRAGTKEQ